MSENPWLQLDAFREAHREQPLEREWRAFARLENGALRFRARVGDKRIKIERPCGYRPGAWRSAGYAPAAGFITSVAAARLRDVVREPARLPIPGVDRADRYRHRRERLAVLTVAQAHLVLVALDQWLEGGGKRTSRLTVIPSEAKQ